MATTLNGTVWRAVKALTVACSCDTGRAVVDVGGAVVLVDGVDGDVVVTGADVVTDTVARCPLEQAVRTSRPAMTEANGRITYQWTRSAGSRGKGPTSARPIPNQWMRMPAPARCPRWPCPVARCGGRGRGRRWAARSGRPPPSTDSPPG